ncbi:MAG TPA: type II secretion system F family protein [Candidatus Enterocloster faecavium]|uniref:Type II secretion system F family protein n=1 Tax=Candidatus Enterocloster faecavium TaxID=2838560 RepID=A0A9D2RLP5_9FIRM|nr:type II secretion system F family protein [Candidatus Enterocloster faecavium]
MQEIPRGKQRSEEKKKRTGESRAGTDYGCYRLSPVQWLAYGGAGAGLCGLTAYIFYRSLAAFLILLPLGILCPLTQKRRLKKKRLRQLSLEFKDGIQILSSYLSAGYALENAFSLSASELRELYGSHGMAAGEFEEIAGKARMNRPVEEGLLDFGERSGLEDVNNFAQVVAAAKRRGGGMVEMISQTASVIRDKIQVQEEIHTMTAAKVLEQQVMSGVPFLIVLYIDFTSPGFFDVMYETAAGRWVMTLCLVLYGAALVLAGHILDIEI